MDRKKLRISGRVQGVGFRYYTQNTAQKMGVTGWVRNASDGTVEAEAQADKETLERFIGKVRKGPPASSVDKIDASKSSVHKGESGFRISY
ncbi:MAG: acylphosphatase [Candidatus Sumerlaeia bacterium]